MVSAKAARSTLVHSIFTPGCVRSNSLMISPHQSPTPRSSFCQDTNLRVFVCAKAGTARVREMSAAAVPARAHAVRDFRCMSSSAAGVVALSLEQAQGLLGRFDPESGAGRQ